MRKNKKCVKFRMERQKKAIEEKIAENEEKREIYKMNDGKKEERK